MRQTVSTNLSRRSLLAAGAGVLTAGGAFYLGARLNRSALPSFRRLTFRRGAVHAARFAPDGRTIVFDAQWEGGPPRIFSLTPDTRDERLLPTPPASLLAVSRSGELALKLEKGSILARVPLQGGTPQEVLRNIVWADWAPDAASFLVVRQLGSRYRIELPISKVWYQTDGEVTEARVSPDGRRIAFFEHAPNAPEDATSLSVVEAGGARWTLVAHAHTARGLVWAPDGKEIWFSAAIGNELPSIYAVTPDGDGRPTFRMPIATAIADILPGGRALFAGWTRRTSMICRPPGDPVERDLSWQDNSQAVDLSENGDVILFNETGAAAWAAHARSLPYIRRTDATPAAAVGAGRALGLSPDAQWAALLLPDSPRRLVIRSTGQAGERSIEQDRFTYADAHWLPDGKRLLVWGNEDGRLSRHYLQDAAGGLLRPITSEGADPEAAISPDGETIAAHTGPGVFLFFADGSQPQPVRGATAGARPVGWTNDGKQLFLRRGSLVDLVDLKTGESELWKNLMPVDAAGVANIGPFHMTPDGEAYVYSYDREQSDLYLAEALK